MVDVGEMRSQGSGAEISAQGSVFTVAGTFNDAPSVVTQTIDNSVNLGGDNIQVAGSSGGDGARGGRSSSNARGGQGVGGGAQGGDNNASPSNNQNNNSVQNGVNLND